MADNGMDEWDKIIRQKVSGLDTPPPGTGWQPGRSWEKLQGQRRAERSLAENPGKPARAERWTWYHAAAAAFVILLIPFAVMLSDIRRQQVVIQRMEAALARERQKIPTTHSAPPAGPAAPGAQPPLARATPPTTAARRKPEPPAVPMTREERRPHQPAAPPAPEPAAEPVADRLAHEPVPAVPQTPVGAALPGQPAPADDSPARLRRLVNTAPKRKATSVTIVFAGTEPDTTGGEVLAANPGPDPATPRRRFLRSFGGTKREETLAAPLQPPSNNILLLLTKQR